VPCVGWSLRAPVCGLSYGELLIDTAARAVTFGGTGVELRPREYDLLVHLTGDPTRVYTDRELLRDIWGYRSQGAAPHSPCARLTGQPSARPGRCFGVGALDAGRRLPARAMQRRG
jgi:hypothetical protein